MAVELGVGIFPVTEGGLVWKPLLCTDLGALQVGEGQERIQVSLVLSWSLLCIQV